MGKWYFTEEWWGHTATCHLGGFTAVVRNFDDRYSTWQIKLAGDVLKEDKIESADRFDSGFHFAHAISEATEALKALSN